MCSYKLITRKNDGATAIQHPGRTDSRQGLRVTMGTSSLLNSSKWMERVPAQEARQAMIQLYQQDGGHLYDLLCHLVLSREDQIHTQFQLMSHIREGSLLDHHNAHQTIPLSDWRISEISLVGIFPSATPYREAVQQLTAWEGGKSCPYHNRFLQPPKLHMCAIPSSKPQPHKQDKHNPASTHGKPQPSKTKTQPPKRMFNVREETKPLNQAPLRVRQEVPVATELEEVRERLEEDRSRRPVTKGMLIESDQEYYDRDKLKEAMGIEEKGRETDGSGKKEEPMEVEIEEKVKDKKFIAESDDEDEAFFDQLQQTKKASSPSQPQRTDPPVVEHFKQSQSPTSSSVTAAVSKPKSTMSMKGGLLGWLNTK